MVQSFITIWIQYNYSLPAVCRQDTSYNIMTLSSGTLATPTTLLLARMIPLLQSRCTGIWSVNRFHSAVFFQGIAKCGITLTITIRITTSCTATACLISGNHIHLIIIIIIIFNKTHQLRCTGEVVITQTHIKNKTIAYTHKARAVVQKRLI